MPRTPRTPPDNFGTQITSASEPNISNSILDEADYLDQNITQRSSKRRRFSQDDVKSQLDDFRTVMMNLIHGLVATQNEKLESLEKHIMEVKAINVSIQTTNTDIEKSTKFLSEQISCFETKINKLESEGKELKCHLNTIEEKVHEIEKRSLKTCIEIRNIPKVHRESKSNLYTYMQSLVTTLQLPIIPTDLRDAYRLPSKPDKKNSTVVIEFTNTLLKSQFLTAAKRYNRDNAGRSLNSTHFGFNDISQPIYISEHLTYKTRRLLFLARDFAKSNNYAYCWTTNGNVYLKRREGMSYILIKHEQQLQELKALTE